MSELEPICDHLVIFSKSQVQVSDSIGSLLANHHVLVGPEESMALNSLNAISSKVAGRQATLLVEGDPGTLGSDWQVLSPDLEEIVLAYLAKPDAGRTAASGVPIETIDRDLS